MVKRWKAVAPRKGAFTQFMCQEIRLWGPLRKSSDASRQQKSRNAQASELPGRKRHTVSPMPK